MAVTELERGIQLLGLQFLFAPIPCLLAGNELRESPTRRRQAVSGLVRYLDTVIAGAELHIRRQSGKRCVPQPFTKTVPAERAYREMQPILPREPTKALAFLQDLKRISSGLRSNRKLSPTDRGKLHSFCHKALNHLDQESFRSTQRLALWFP